MSLWAQVSLSFARRVRRRTRAEDWWNSVVRNSCAFNVYNSHVFSFDGK